MDVSDSIVEGLKVIENIGGVDILFAVEAGSRAWGYASSQSDYDVRFIYKRNLSWYLNIHERRDVIEGHKINDLIECSGWDLKKALFQIHRGNPAFFEWLSSPIVYSNKKNYIQTIKAFEGKYFNPRSAIYHYLHLAHGNYHRYLEKKNVVTLKKYIYVIRALLCCKFIEKRHSMPPVDISILIDSLKNDSSIPFNDINYLIERKMTSENLGDGPIIEILSSWCESMLDHFSKIARTTAKVSNSGDDLNEFLLLEIIKPLKFGQRGL